MPRICGLMGLGWLTCWTIAAADFVIISPGFSYAIEGKPGNPTLTLERGKTYTFAISTAVNHPFQILGAGAAVQNNNLSSGTITCAVPIVAKSYRYECSIHHFGGQVLTVAAPPTPPDIEILSLALGDDLVLRSTGTTHWSVLPEFATNLTAANWFALTVHSNNFAGGTNETFCGRPPGMNFFDRIRSLPS